MSPGSDGRPALPAWAETLRQKYLAGEASVFVLYRNVFDRYRVGERYYTLLPFLSEVLLKDNKQHIYELSVDLGVRVIQGGSAEEKAELYRHLEGKGLNGIFESLERQMRGQGSSALLIPYAGTLFPAAELHQLSLEERGAFTALHRWSLDEQFANRDNVVILVSESLADLSPALLTHPRVLAIALPMPDRADRHAAIRHYSPGMPAAEAEPLADHTAGLRLIQLASIVASEAPQGMSQTQRRTLIASLLQGSPQAAERAEKLAAITAGMTPAEIRQIVDPTRALPESGDPAGEMMALVRQRKRELIEKECAGLIEFIDPRHGLESVGGNEPIKSELLDIARLIQGGERARAPMGLLAVGPMGSGKTFVIKAFLKEAGLSGIALKNFRSKWVGSTEANLDRVLATVKAMGPIALLIDEGDRSFGRQGDDADGGTSSRVIARLKEFMSDPENRGQVLFILLTNRPDKLDTDIKRPGRLDRKIPFFYAETAAERAAVMGAVFERYRVPVDFPEAHLLAACEGLEGYSNADLEALALLAAEFAERAQRIDSPLPSPPDARVRTGAAATPAVSREVLARAIEDFMPPQETAMVGYMEMLAVAETSRRSLLPQRFRSLSAREVQERLAELRRQIQP
ncbi:ATP-binding protein [Candidatus Accumulibacter vicinus]|uniref:ATP-dependent zinc metalloprotease FtsH 1 n=1 Tax=Candidatus Accumulibacter vicinus TaxID=2954382 RepID=A0A084Y5U4_9PROT|nr:ATP-binding protein [Candidatus Accumulibacter vicinus]KFB70088.1 MAG: ATP-dependent zinc metalloprotease FtsH 1 [Candidatus Accumulibacter vicinus]